MKSKILSCAFVSALVIAVFLGIHFTGSEAGDGAFLPASARRDCAPWDGMAYTIDIRFRAGVVIEISIWQPPDFPLAVSYFFPDASGRVGIALYRPAFGSEEALKGKIVLQPFEEGAVIEGRFSFVSESGKDFSGKFSADWLNQPVACG